LLLSSGQVAAFSLVRPPERVDQKTPHNITHAAALLISKPLELVAQRARNSKNHLSITSSHAHLHVTRSEMRCFGLPSNALRLRPRENRYRQPVFTRAGAQNETNDHRDFSTRRRPAETRPCVRASGRLFRQPGKNRSPRAFPESGRHCGI